MYAERTKCFHFDGCKNIIFLKQKNILQLFFHQLLKTFKTR